MATAAVSSDECGRLRSELLHGALKEQVVVSNELQSAKKKLRKVRREHNNLQQAVIDKRVDTEKASHEYAKATCRALCEDVYHRFPRELRNMIYGHIHSQLTLSIASDHFTSERATTPVTGWVVHHHVWDPAFVTTKMHAELIEHYFRATTFRFYTYFEYIAKFRVADPWKTGFIPAQFPTNIMVTVACANYILDYVEPEDKDNGDDEWNSNNSWGDGSWGHTSHSPHKTSSDLLTDLEVLFGFHHATKLEIDFIPDKKWRGNPLKKQDWMRKHLIPLVVPTLLRLRMSGYHVCFMLRGLFYLCHDFPNFVVESFTSLEACNAQFEEFMSEGKKAYQQAKLDASEEAEISGADESDYTDSE